MNSIPQLSPINMTIAPSNTQASGVTHSKKKVPNLLPIKTKSQQVPILQPIKQLDLTTSTTTTNSIGTNGSSMTPNKRTYIAIDSDQDEPTSSHRVHASKQHESFKRPKSSANGHGPTSLSTTSMMIMETGDEYKRADHAASPRLSLQLPLEPMFRPAATIAASSPHQNHLTSTAPASKASPGPLDEAMTPPLPPLVPVLHQIQLTPTPETKLQMEERKAAGGKMMHLGMTLNVADLLHQPSNPSKSALSLESNRHIEIDLTYSSGDEDEGDHDIKAAPSEQSTKSTSHKSSHPFPAVTSLHQQSPWMTSTSTSSISALPPPMMNSTLPDIPAFPRSQVSNQQLQNSHTQKCPSISSPTSSSVSSARQTSLDHFRFHHKNAHRSKNSSSSHVESALPATTSGLTASPLPDLSSSSPPMPVPFTPPISVASNIPLTSVATLLKPVRARSATLWLQNKPRIEVDLTKDEDEAVEDQFERKSDHQSQPSTKPQQPKSKKVIRNSEEEEDDQDGTWSVRTDSDDEEEEDEGPASRVGPRHQAIIPPLLTASTKPAYDQHADDWIASEKPYIDRILKTPLPFPTDEEEEQAEIEEDLRQVREMEEREAAAAAKAATSARATPPGRQSKHKKKHRSKKTTRNQHDAGPEAERQYTVNKILFKRLLPRFKKKVGDLSVVRDPASYEYGVSWERYSAESDTVEPYPNVKQVITDMLNDKEHIPTLEEYLRTTKKPSPIALASAPSSAASSATSSPSHTAKAKSKTKSRVRSKSPEGTAVASHSHSRRRHDDTSDLDQDDGTSITTTHSVDSTTLSLRASSHSRSKSNRPTLSRLLHTPHSHHQYDSSSDAPLEDSEEWILHPAQPRREVDTITETVPAAAAAASSASRPSVTVDVLHGEVIASSSHDYMVDSLAYDHVGDHGDHDDASDDSSDVEIFLLNDSPSQVDDAVPYAREFHFQDATNPHELMEAMPRRQTVVIND